MRMRVPDAVDYGRFWLSDDDESAVGGAQHLDRYAVQAGERLARDHLLRRALDRRAFRDVDDTVEVAEDRIDVVSDEQDCDVLVPADLPPERFDSGLVVR